jgi:pyridoxal phosphate enzyme (YggS family)
MPRVKEQLAEVRARIADACLRLGRDRNSVELIAVSKTFPVEAIQAAVDAGHSLFGESRQQEAEPKIAALPDSLRWHFIGRVQRNKVRKILACFDAVHAVDSLSLAEQIDRIAGELGCRPGVFLQVNAAAEATKGGYAPDGLRRDMNALLALPHLELRGLMTIPPIGATPEASRRWFAGLRELRDQLATDFGAVLPELSMGMSDDFEIAIEEGANLVRVGSAIFGARAYEVDGELGSS